MSHLHSTKDPLYHLTWKILGWMLGMTIILSCWTLSQEMLQHSSQNGADTTTFAPSRASMPQMMPIPATLMTSLLICLGNQRLLMTQYYGMILWMMHSGRRWTTSYHVLRIESSSTLRNSNLSDVIDFGGFTITPSGIRPSISITDAIHNFPVPTDITGIHSWFGLVSQVAYAFSMILCCGFRCRLS